MASKLDPGHDTAALTLSADLRNVSPRPVKGVLRAELDGIRVSQPVELAASESKTVRLVPESHPELVLRRPRLWWPHTMGEPSLYTATFAFDSSVMSICTRVASASGPVSTLSTCPGEAKDCPFTWLQSCLAWSPPKRSVSSRL